MRCTNEAKSLYETRWYYFRNSFGGERTLVRRKSSLHCTHSTQFFPVTIISRPSVLDAPICSAATLPLQYLPTTFVAPLSFLHLPARLSPRFLRFKVTIHCTQQLSLTCVNSTSSSSQLRWSRSGYERYVIVG